MATVYLGTACRPLFILLFISGLYITHVKHCTFRKGMRSLVGLTICVTGLCGNVYSTRDQVMDLLRALNAVDGDYLLEILGILFYGSTVYIAIFQAISITRHLPNFFQLAEGYCTRYKRNVNVKMVLITSAIASSTCFVLSILFALAYYWTTQELAFPDSNTGHTEGTLASVVVSIVHLTRSFWLPHRTLLYHWSLATVYLFLWSMLYTEMKHFNAEVRAEVKKSLSCSNVEFFRMRHAAICQMIGDANAALRHFLFTVYGAGIPVMLLCLRGIIYGWLLRDEVVFVVVYVLAYHCTMLCVVTITGAALARQTRRPADMLHQLSVNNMSEDGFHSVYMFLSRLQSTSIGFEVYGMFTIDTSTILMVLGTVTTYAVVVMQIQSSGSVTAELATPSVFNVTLPPHLSHR